MTCCASLQQVSNGEKWAPGTLEPGKKKNANVAPGPSFSATQGAMMTFDN